MLAVIVGRREGIVIENLRFHAQRCQNRFGLYHARATQTIVQQADEFQVGQACGDVGRLIKAAQEIPIQIHPFHPLEALYRAVEGRKSVVSEIEVGDAVYDRPTHFADMIPGQVQRAVNISDRKIFIEREVIAGQDEILKVHARLEDSNAIIARLEQFQLGEVLGLDGDLWQSIVVDKELTDLIIGDPKPYQLVVRQIDWFKGQIGKRERMDGRDMVVTDI